MSFRRLAASFGVEFKHTFRRPLFIFLAVILILSAWGLSSGKMQISSGDSSAMVCCLPAGTKMGS